jgi:hypothetical protein
MVEETVISWATILIIIFAALVVIILLLDEITGLGIVRSLTCGVLYWIPFGNYFTTLTDLCQAITV